MSLSLDNDERVLLRHAAANLRDAVTYTAATPTAKQTLRRVTLDRVINISRSLDLTVEDVQTLWAALFQLAYEENNLDFILPELHASKIGSTVA